MRESAAANVDQILERMCGEYLEMPGLRLTCRQAQRLWGLDEGTCLQLLGALLEVGFLRQTRDGLYARTTDGPARLPKLRMCQATLDAVDLIRDREPLLQAAGAGPQRSRPRRSNPG